MPTITSVAASTARRSSRELRRSRGRSRCTTITAATTSPATAITPAEQQPVLEPEARAHAVEPRVLLAHEVGAVGVRAEAERDDLRADDHQQRAGDHRVQVPLAAEDVDLQRATTSAIERAEREHAARPGA